MKLFIVHLPNPTALNDSTFAPHPLPLPSGERGRVRGLELNVKELFAFVLVPWFTTTQRSQ